MSGQLPLIGSREVIGRFYNTLEQDAGLEWVDSISMLFSSDQDGETYAWIGQSPVMREWIGGRHAKGFTENSIELKNTHFEATVEFLVKDMRRDKSSQVDIRIDDLAKRTNSHWASLLSTLIVSGESALSYDGQFFFDTDHAEGESGVQSNKIDVDISALPAEVHGVVTAPSVAEMQQAILAGVTQIQGFVDDQSEPMNETANQFLVMVPTTLHIAALNALAVAGGTALESQTGHGLNIRVVSNARLNTWNDKFAIFRTDGATKPFIRQQETEVQLKAKAEGSEFEFDNDAHQYGVDSWRTAGLGYWQHACLVKMV